LKIEINIEKKHLIFFGVFIILIGSVFVLGNYESFGHSADEVGPGMMGGPIFIEVQQGYSGNALSARTESGDGIIGQTFMDGKSSIYGYVSPDTNAYSGWFEGGDVGIYSDGNFGSKLVIMNQETTGSIKVDLSGNLIFSDHHSGATGFTLSELVAIGGTETSLLDRCRMIEEINYEEILCDVGEMVVGGGIDCTTGTVLTSMPTLHGEAYGWRAYCDGTPYDSTIRVICCQ